MEISSPTGKSSVAPAPPDKKQLGPLLLLGAAVYILWAIWALWLRDRFPAEGRGEVVAGVVARLVFWVLPCAVYGMKVWGPRFGAPLGLSFPLGASQAKRSLVLLVATSLALFLATAARNGTTLWGEMTRFAQLAQPRLTAPIFEELVFRGVFLSELLTWTHRNSRSDVGLRVRYWVGQLGCAVFFVLLHWPAWWRHLGLCPTIERSVPIFAVAMILGFVFAQTRSIWPCIWLHWLNNELSFIER